MIRLFKVKEQQKENVLRNGGGPPVKKQTAGELRLNKEPNHEDPLNHEAAELLRDNPYAFESSVRLAMEGGRIGHTWYTRCIENPYD